MEVPQKLKIKLLHDTAISLLARYLTEMKTVSYRDICTRMFVKKHYSPKPRLGNNISGPKKYGMYKMEYHSAMNISEYYSERTSCYL